MLLPTLSRPEPQAPPGHLSTAAPRAVLAPAGSPSSGSNESTAGIEQFQQRQASVE
jgi:hypothetical protein